MFPASRFWRNNELHLLHWLRSMGVVGRYHYEIAELYYGSLKEEGLTVQMVEVDDE